MVMVHPVEIAKKIETRGRKRKTSPTTDHHIVIQVKRNRFMTAMELKNTMPPGVDVSLNTIRNRIKESGEFNWYWAARKPFIATVNKRRRLAWANERIN